MSDERLREIKQALADYDGKILAMNDPVGMITDLVEYVDRLESRLKELGRQLEPLRKM